MISNIGELSYDHCFGKTNYHGSGITCTKDLELISVTTIVIVEL